LDLLSYRWPLEPTERHNRGYQYQQRANATLSPGPGTQLSALRMETLRWKTPELVRKEIWTHILAYNLIRTIMAKAAVKSSAMPRSICFKGTIQMLEAYKPTFAMGVGDGSALRQQLYQWLLDAIATHRVGNRPNRVVPRLRKRRRKHNGFLRQPRQATKDKMLKALTR